MFVPLGAPVEALPGFPPASSAPHLIPDLCVTPNNVPASFSMKTASRKSTTHETNVTTTTPLDLRKSPGTRSEGSTSGHGDDDSSQDMRMQSPSNAARSPSESRQTPDPHSAKQKEFEAQLQFLKAKQVRFARSENTHLLCKEGSITVHLTSCLTGFVFSSFVMLKSLTYLLVWFNPKQ